MAFSADGRQILLGARSVRDGRGIDEIYTYDGTTLRVFAGGHSPAWYPDGQSITFVRKGGLYVRQYKWPRKCKTTGCCWPKGT